MVHFLNMLHSVDPGKLVMTHQTRYNPLVTINQFSFHFTGLSVLFTAHITGIYSQLFRAFRCISRSFRRRCIPTRHFWGIDKIRKLKWTSKLESSLDRLFYYRDKVNVEHYVQIVLSISDAQSIFKCLMFLPDFSDASHYQPQQYTAKQISHQLPHYISSLQPHRPV